MRSSKIILIMSLVFCILLIPCLVSPAFSEQGKFTLGEEVRPLVLWEEMV